jgi:hypothetical protein
MLNAFQHRNSSGVPVGAKKKQKIRNGANPELPIIIENVPPNCELLHQQLVKVHYLPVSLHQTLASIITKTLHIRLFPS